MSPAFEAGDGEHHYYLLKAPVASPDRAPLEARQHYLGIDAVRWYVNKKSNFFRDRMASGTVQLLLANNETYEVGLGIYELKAGARTAPVFSRLILPNRVFRGGGITVKAFVRAIQRNTLLGELLVDMARASLSVVAGAVQGVTVAGPPVALLAAGKSLTEAVSKILQQGDHGLTVFDQSGVDVTLLPNRLLGPENYLLLHRGAELDSARLSLRENQGELEVLFDDDLLDDGAWVLFRIRREDKYGGPRPWEDEARNVRNELDELMDRYDLGGKTKEEVKAELTPNADKPTLADRVLAVISQIRKDYALAEREAVEHSGELRAFLELAQDSVNKPKKGFYSSQRQAWARSLAEGAGPPPLLRRILAAEAAHIGSDRSVTLAPDVPRTTDWVEKVQQRVRITTLETDSDVTSLLKPTRVENLPGRKPKIIVEPGPLGNLLGGKIGGKKGRGPTGSGGLGGGGFGGGGFGGGGFGGGGFGR